jgi:DNA polymerase-3 subunit gamma/tau
MAEAASMHEAVRSMLGLADRSRVVELFGNLMAGDVAAALASFPRSV